MWNIISSPHYEYLCGFIVGLYWKKRGNLCQEIGQPEEWSPGPGERAFTPSDLAEVKLTEEEWRGKLDKGEITWDMPPEAAVAAEYFHKQLDSIKAFFAAEIDNSKLTSDATLLGIETKSSTKSRREPISILKSLKR